MPARGRFEAVDSTPSGAALHCHGLGRRGARRLRLPRAGAQIRIHRRVCRTRVSGKRIHTDPEKRLNCFEFCHGLFRKMFMESGHEFRIL